MPKFMKKTSLGRFLETDSWDSDVAEVRMTMEEYREIEKQFQDQRRETERIEQERSREVQQIQQAAIQEKLILEQKVKEIEDNSEIEFDALGREIDKLTDLLQQAQNLNQNLKRICREKSNAERKVRPKKKHPGYLFISSQQIQRRVKKKVPYEEWRRENPIAQKKEYRTYLMVDITLWRNKIETYYDVNIPIESIQSEILSELDLLLKNCGVEFMEYDLKDIPIDDLEGRSIAFDFTFKANFHSGLWEIELLSSKQLQVAPMIQKRYYQGIPGTR